MRTYKTKKELLSAWGSKIKTAKQYHKIMKEQGYDVGPFYKSDVYKGLKRKENRSAYRYDNKEKISQQRKERRLIHKEQIEYIRENKENINFTYSGSAIDAFKGRRGLSDKKFVENIKYKNFVGELTVSDGETGEILEEKTYFSAVRYFARVSYWINKLFSKSEGYQIFNSTVYKRQKYVKETETLYWFYEIEINS